LALRRVALCVEIGGHSDQSFNFAVQQGNQLARRAVRVHFAPRTAFFYPENNSDFSDIKAKDILL
jgi:hypothetical protein